MVELQIDGQTIAVPEGTTLLEACNKAGVETPTMCYLSTLTPVNVCRVCVVELEGSRALVPACSRRVEAGMIVHTNSERVRHSRRMVLEFLASSVDLSLSPEAQGYLARYGAKPERYGTPAASDDRDHAHAGHHQLAGEGRAATVHQQPKLDNDLFVRDYSRCILCYKCVEACGADAQNTFAIAVAGRGFDTRISTEFSTGLTDSACVFCGNCIGVCPTGALMFKSEYDLRQQGEWDETRQTQTETICPYCGVGCALTLHVQDNRIVKATSPLDSSVTSGNLCIKGRFGWRFVQSVGDPIPLSPVDSAGNRTGSES
jgi:predicted molibdopterin-dependent oxidoreductase YjgC